MLVGRICRGSLQTTMIKQPAEGPAAAKAPSDKAPGTSEPGWAAYLGGAARVGAAAGYAALALRFKNLGSRTDFTTGGAEFRAAQAFSRDWSKVSEQAERLSADEIRDRARRAFQESVGAGPSGRGSSSRCISGCGCFRFRILQLFLQPVSSSRCLLELLINFLKSCFTGGRSSLGLLQLLIDSMKFGCCSFRCC